MHLTIFLPKRTQLHLLLRDLIVPPLQLCLLRLQKPLQLVETDGGAPSILLDEFGRRR